MERTYKICNFPLIEGGEPCIKVSENGTVIFVSRSTGEFISGCWANILHDRYLLSINAGSYDFSTDTQISEPMLSSNIPLYKDVPLGIFTLPPTNFLRLISTKKYPENFIGHKLDDIVFSFAEIKTKVIWVFPYEFSSRIDIGPYEFISLGLNECQEITI